MVRLRLPYGLVSADQLEVMADAVDRCGKEGNRSSSLGLLTQALERGNAPGKPLLQELA